ncbi:hypothetical protein RI367_002116 [Sorochytrium milnesiophthora]
MSAKLRRDMLKVIPCAFLVLLGAAQIQASVGPILQQWFSPIDGSGHNLNNTALGAADTPYSRRVPYVNYNYSTRPSARLVSQQVFGRREGEYSTGVASAFAVFLGQFLAHDLLRSPINSSDPLPIPVSQCDEDYDQQCLGNVTMSFGRQAYVSVNSTTGARVYSNMLSAWVDATQIYGRNEAVTNQLRSFQQGMLTMGNNGLLPMVPAFNGQMDSTNSYNWSQLFLAGDVRANENAALQTLHTLFVREHNRRAAYLASQNPLWTDDLLFYTARKWVIGVWQKIVFDEYIPLLIGGPLPTYTGYDPTIDPSIDVLFMGAAFRYGHSAVPNLVFQITGSGDASLAGHFLLRDTLFETRFVQMYGIEDILRGLVTQNESFIDSLLVGELLKPMRNQPFDLAAFNVQRGRDLGLPTYNDARRFYRLPPARSFADVTSEVALQNTLSSLYGNVENLDVFVGGLCEPHVSNGRVGALFAAIITEQFLRLRDGDRCFYRGNTGFYTPAEVAEINTFSLQKVVLANTNIQQFPSSPLQVTVSPKTAFTSSPASTCQTANQTQSSYQVTSGFTVAWTISPSAQTITFEYRLGYTSGWFGFGLGNSMVNVDIWAVTISSSGTVDVGDYWSTNFQPIRDTDQSGTNDIQNVQDLGAINGYSKVIRFTRAYTTSDSKDTPIVPGPMNVIFAWSTTSSTLAYHGSNRGTSQVVFIPTDGSTSASQTTSTSTTAVSTSSRTFKWSASLRILHGLLMMAAFGCLIPYSIYVTRYHQHDAHWVETHESLNQLAMKQYIFAGSLGILGSQDFLSGVHGQLGLTTVLCSVVQVLMGLAIKINPERARQYKSEITWTHITLGFLILGSGNVNCFLGAQMMAESDSYYSFLTPAYASLLLLWILIFMNGERLKRKHPLQGKHSLGNLTAAGHAWVAHSKLPEFQWEDVAMRVSKGSMWLVLDNYVYDIQSLIDTHPGGQAIIASSIGTDATMLFENGGVPPEGRKKQTETLWQPPVAVTASTQIAVLKRRTHTHSRLARAKLKALAVGWVAERNVGPDSSLWLPPKFPPASSNTGTHTHCATLMPLIEKVDLVGQHATKRLYRLRFQFEQPHHQLWCCPGDYLIVQYVTKGNKILQRPFTPIVYQSTGYLDLIVKVYRDGALSKHLGALQVGEDVTIRGPFRGRDLLKPSATKECYDEVGIIVAGSGLTPALLLLDYYLNFGRRDNRDRLRHRISLLFVNEIEQDIFFQQELEHLVIEFGGALQVHYLVKYPTSTWKSYYGKITKQILKETMPAPPTLTALPQSVPATVVHQRRASVDPSFSAGAAPVVAKRGIIKSISSDLRSARPPLSMMELRPSESDYMITKETASAGASLASSTSKASLPTMDPGRKDLQIVVCGPPAFNSSVKETLEEAGYDPSTVVLL